jgi:hypothetical protein
MSELNQDPFDARWLNCLYGGKLSGVVTKIGDTYVLIQPILSITLPDGSPVDKFYASKNNCKQEIFLRDYVLFEWKNVGKRTLAIEVERVNERIASELATQTKNVLPEKLKERWNECVNNLNQTVENLAQSRIAELKQEINSEKLRLEKEALDLQNKSDNFYIRLQELTQREQDLTKEKENLNKRAEELAPYALAVPISKPEIQVISQALPSNLGNIWQEQLLLKELQVLPNIANSYLISLFSGFYSGSIVLLNGSVGVGKTSIVKKSAELLSSPDACSIIPVRPAWIEPADLLGFFDPIHEIFRPTSFLSALKKAENEDKLHLICLDELNLAKIENYASDLLSKLEYSRKNDDPIKNSLLLFSGNIEEELWGEINYLNEQEDLDPKQKARQQRLRKFLSNHRSHQPVPQNIVLLGTLNSDETTYDLSPKVIDRAYTITYPIADFRSEQHPSQKALTRPITISTSKLRELLNKLYDENFKLLKERKLNGWEHIKDWNEDYMSSFPHLGTPLGYRTRTDYAAFYSVGTWLGLGEEEIIGHFLFTKILPRISFSKDDKTTKWFQGWLEELKQNYKDYDPANVLDRLELQLKDERRQMVRYWE